MRTASDVKMGSSFPHPGKYSFVVSGLSKGKSEQKGTPFIGVTHLTDDDEFEDRIFVTPKALARMCLFARRICGMPDDFQLPDDDKEASIIVAKYILENGKGKSGVVTVEEIEEEYIPTSGQNMGRKVQVKKRRVAFRGYDRKPDESFNFGANEKKSEGKIDNDPFPWEQQIDPII